MPQILQVLRCFKCLVFQVHQAKKCNKFSCKMCGEKQSIKRHYGLGTGQECRLQVQRLNGLRGELNEINENIQLNDDCEEEQTEPLTGTTFYKGKSKWSNFVDDDNEINEPKHDEPMYLGTTEVVLEVPKKVKRFIKPKLANQNIKVKNDYHSGKTTPWSKPWPNKNEITKTDFSYIKHESTEVLCSQRENNFKHKLSEENIVHDIPKPKIIKKFELSKVSKQSKWAQFTEDEVENAEYMQKNNNYKDENNEICFNSDVQANSIKQHSQECEEIPESLTQFEKTNAMKTNIFSTCDESELDSILDI